MNNFTYALRYLFKSRGNNLTRIISLALGLLVGLLMFSYITYDLTYDRFIPDRERVYQMWYTSGMVGMSEYLYAPIAPALKEEMPQVEAATRLMLHGADAFYYGDNYIDGRLLSVDTSFFDVLDYGVVKGDPHEIFRDARNIMISESFAKKLFGGKDPVGEILMRRNRVPFTVMGVFRDIPNNTHLGKFDVLGSFEAVINDGYGTGWLGGDMYPTYIKLHEGGDIAEIEAQLGGFFERHGLGDSLKEWQQTYFFVPVTKSQTTGNGLVEIAMLLALIAFVTLFIACMNYVLISISMLLKRGKTIAMLKVGGAKKKDIFSIFLWETLLIVLVALALAVLIILCFEKQLESMIQIPIAELFAWERIWAPSLVILGIFLIAGIVPSRIFASIPVSIAFRGTPASRRRWKQTLIFIQMVCVTFVVVFLIINARQYNHISTADYGYNRYNLALTSLRGTTDAIASYKSELMSIPQVEGVGIGYDLPIWNFSGQPAFDDITGELLFSCRYGVIDHDYIPVMGMEIVDGRNFTAEDAGDKVIVNEKYVEMRGWTDSPIGKHISDSPDQGHAGLTGVVLPDGYTIIGVVKNFWTADTGYIPPLVYHNTKEILTSPDRQYNSGYIMIRLGDTDSGTKEMLTQKIKSFYDVQHFEVLFYETLVDERIYYEKQFRDTMILVSLVTLFIAIMGLVGYLGDEIRRRSKEIAIRRVNGAARGDIIKLIARDAALVTLPAVAVGLVGAWLLGSIWMQSFQHKAGLPWWVFVCGGAAVILIVYVTELAKTWRTAGSNPVKMIKNE